MSIMEIELTIKSIENRNWHGQNKCRLLEKDHSLGRIRSDELFKHFYELELERSRISLLKSQSLNT